jgi:hypothetical protein
MLARVVAVPLAGVKLDLGLPSRAIDSLPALELGERCCRGPAWGQRPVTRLSGVQSVGRDSNRPARTCFCFGTS